MKYLLDTNMCIYAQKQEPSVLSKIRENYRDGIAISSITIEKLEFGVQASANRERNTIAMLKFLAIVDVLPFENKAAAEYGKIRSDLKKRERRSVQWICLSPPTAKRKILPSLRTIPVNLSVLKPCCLTIGTPPKMHSRNPQAYSPRAS